MQNIDIIGEQMLNRATAMSKIKPLDKNNSIVVIKSERNEKHGFR